MYASSQANSNSHITSLSDPKAICIKWAFSLDENLPKPSAMFIGTDITDLRN